MTKLFLAVFCAGVASSQGMLTTIAGAQSFYAGAPAVATSVEFGELGGMTTDNAGNVYFADLAKQMIFRLGVTGQAERVAGNGLRGESPDGAALTLSLNMETPRMRVNRAGELIFLEGKRIRKLTAAGVVVTLYAHPDFRITALTLDSSDRMYVSLNFGAIYRVTVAGVAEKFAGGGGAFGTSVEGAPAVESPVGYVQDIAVAASGIVYFLESDSGRVRAVTTDGILRTIAGNGSRFGGDDGPAITAGLGFAYSLALHPSGDIYVQSGSLTDAARIRRIRPSGIIEHFAGTTPGFGGDNGPAASASLSWAIQMSFDPSGSLYFADTGNRRIRRIDTARRITTVAGGGLDAPLAGAPPWATPIGYPSKVAVSPSGAIAIISVGSPPELRELGLDGVLRWLPLTMAPPLSFLGVAQIAYDQRGVLHLAHADRISRWNSDGTLTTVVGGNSQGLDLPNVPARETKLNGAGGLAFSPAGELYYSDWRTNHVRRVDGSGIVRIVAGEANVRFGGDGGPAANSGLSSPGELAFDSGGNLLILDSGNRRIRKVSHSGIITTFAGTSETHPAQNPIEATKVQLGFVPSLTTDLAGNVYFLEATNPALNIISPNGLLNSIPLGPAYPPNEPDALYRYVNSIAIDRAGRVLIADGRSRSIVAYLRVLPALEIPIQSIVLSTTAPTASFRVNAALPGVPVAAATATPSWLTVAQSSRVTPSTIQVTADYSRLAAGRHLGRINIAGRTVDVTMEVPELGAAAPSVDRAPLVFRGTGAQSISIRNTGGGSMNFRVAAPGATWLSVSPTSGQSTGSNPGAVTISANTGSLAPGVYTGVVQVTAEEQTIEVPVTLIVGGSRLRLLNKGLSLLGRERGAVTAPRTLRVESDGTFQAAATTLSGGNWLNIATSAAEIAVTADPSALAPGDYFGEVRITAANSRSPQVATVGLRVLPRAFSISPAVLPLAITAAGPGDSKPPSNDIFVYNPYDELLSFSISNDASGWVEFSPQRAAIPPGGVARIAVQTYTSSEAPVRRTSLNFSFSDGSTRAVELLVLSRAAGCVSRRLYNQFTAFDMGDPAHIEVRVTDECGQPAPPNTSVALRFSSREADAPLHPIGGGVWTGTWSPERGVSPVTITAFAALGAQTGSIDLPVLTGPATEAPIVRAGAVVHAASQRGDLPLATATLVTLYGANLAAAQRQAPGAPLPTVIDGTQVLIGGAPVPLLFVSPNQINAQIPPGLIPNEAYPIVVRRGERQSSPETLAIAPAQPGIFTVDQSGSGQGIVLGVDQVTLANRAAPAERGQAIIIYGTGFGPTTMADGLPRTQFPVTVSVGGAPANVLYSGLTAGFAGLYQVNAVLGESTPTGDAVPVVVTANGRASNTVTISVK